MKDEHKKLNCKEKKNVSGTKTKKGRRKEAR